MSELSERQIDVLRVFRDELRHEGGGSTGKTPPVGVAAIQTASATGEVMIDVPGTFEINMPRTEKRLKIISDPLAALNAPVPRLSEELSFVERALLAALEKADAAMLGYIDRYNENSKFKVDMKTTVVDFATAAWLYSLEEARKNRPTPPMTEEDAAESRLRMRKFNKRIERDLAELNIKP